MFLGKAGTDLSTVGCPEDTPILDAWLRADEIWQKMLDAGLRAMLLLDSPRYCELDEPLVEYFDDLIDRDGFVTDPAYWDEVRQSWRQFLTEEHCRPCGKDIKQQRQTGRLRFRVIETKEPSMSPPRGICSPTKTAEIRKFENSAKVVFGDVESSTTAWLAE